jgi:RNA polymerase sigma factor (sigma-70 family)
MAGEPLHAVIRQLRRAAARQGIGGLTDAELLERFVGRRDEGAFELLVWRHGALVLDTCRRVLGHAHDAEDAFQATFLALVRQAASLGRRATVAGWLYRVAHRIALRLRARAATRARREGQHAPPPAAPEGTEPRSELRAILDEELNRLPEHYRAAVVLCYLEGRTTEEAARQLGCPRGTILSRLAQARARLRARLSHRGLALAAPAVVTALSGPASAAVPAALVDGTVKAALAFAADGALAPEVAALTRGGIQAMLLTRLKIAAVLLLVAGALGAGTVLLAHPGLAADPGAGRAPPAPQKDAKPAPPGKPKDDRELLEGTWEMVKAIRAGKELPPRKVDRVFLFTRGYILQKRDQGFSPDVLTYHLDPTQKPRAVTLERADRPGDRTHLGIYRLEGDTWTVCVSTGRNAERPTEFASTAESGTELLVFRRIGKAEKVQEATIRAHVEQVIGRRRIARNLFRVGEALMQYHHAHRRLPAAAIFSQDGKPLLSWRVALLPYLGEDDLYRQFKLDEPWDSAHNKKLLEKMPEFFAPPPGKARDEYATFYRVFTGLGTAFEGKEGLKLDEFPDGRSTTLLVVEAGMAVPWTKPDELPYDANPLPKLGGVFEGRFHLVMADGSVHLVGPRFDEDTMRRIITRNDGKVINLDDLGR